VTLHPEVLADMLEAEASVARDRLGHRASALSVTGACVIVVFGAPDLTWRLSLDGTHYDALPFAVSVIDENGQPQSRENWPPGLAHGDEHPVLHRPWACLRGTLEYHMYPGHSADPWEFSRGDLRAADILDHLLQKCGQ
jgi:hypothetical protein